MLTHRLYVWLPDGRRLVFTQGEDCEQVRQDADGSCHVGNYWGDGGKLPGRGFIIRGLPSVLAVGTELP